MTDAVVVRAHAKLNLFLRILAREDDGYHGLETLFCLVSLADEVEVTRTPARGITLDTGGADLGPVADNLAVRAARVVLEATGDPFGIHIRLGKQIPARAGLGGGSSDAAAALTAVNALAGNAVPRHELLQFGARLGADVPYFVTGAPLALGWGHGDRLLRLPPLPAAPALLVVPERPVATAEAYSWIDAARTGSGRRGAVALDLDVLRTWGDIGRMAGNDFESPVFSRHPDIRAAFESMVGTRPLVCRMSGSGSALFAIYRSSRDRDDAAMRLGRKHGVVIAVETLAGVAPGPIAVDRTDGGGAKS